MVTVAQANNLKKTYLFKLGVERVYPEFCVFRKLIGSIQ